MYIYFSCFSALISTFNSEIMTIFKQTIINFTNLECIAPLGVGAYQRVVVMFIINKNNIFGIE